jgi:hypothetical protein
VIEVVSFVIKHRQCTPTITQYKWRRWPKLIAKLMVLTMMDIFIKIDVDYYFLYFGFFMSFFCIF